MSFFSNLGQEIQSDIAKVETLFEADVWPYVKEFLAALLSQEGKVALKAAVAALPQITSGQETAAASAVAAAVASSLAANAAADAQTVIQSVETNVGNSASTGTADTSTTSS